MTDEQINELMTDGAALVGEHTRQKFIISAAMDAVALLTSRAEQGAQVAEPASYLNAWAEGAARASKEWAESAAVPPMLPAAVGEAVAQGLRDYAAFCAFTEQYCHTHALLWSAYARGEDGPTEARLREMAAVYFAEAMAANERYFPLLRQALSYPAALVDARHAKMTALALLPPSAFSGVA